MTKTLVLGYGNLLRGDDGIGVRVAEILSEDPANEDVNIVACGQLTPDLAEAVSRCKRVLFVDASMDDPPGSIVCHPVSPCAREAVSFTHSLDPGSLLVWARELFGAEPEAVLITMGGESFDLSDQLSPGVAKNLPVLVERVRSWIAHSGDKPSENHRP